MSSALVRQALELVDQEECGVNRRRKSDKRGSKGQDHRQLYKQRGRKNNSKSSEKRESLEEKVTKLLALSTSTADQALTNKIVERAVKGRAIQEVIPEKEDPGKSILFPEEESYEQFEEEQFCS